MLTWEHFDVRLIQPKAQPIEIHAWWEEAATCHARMNYALTRVNEQCAQSVRRHQLAQSDAATRVPLR